MPGIKEDGVGAIMEDGTIYLNHLLIKHSQISRQYLDKEIITQMKEIKRRTELYRRGRNCLIYDFNTIVVVDDGASTGSTIIAAAKWIHTHKLNRLDKNHKNFKKRLVVALPVAPTNTVNLLERECDAEVEVILKPPSYVFSFVEQYYDNFPTITDLQVIEIMKSRGLLPSSLIVIFHNMAQTYYEYYTILN